MFESKSDKNAKRKFENDEKYQNFAGREKAKVKEIREKEIRQQE